MIIAIIGILFIFIAFVLSIACLDDDKVYAIVVFFISALGWCCIVSSTYKDNLTHPTAIEVYQGKTTLKITYQDSIAVDSVVVYKK